MLTRYALCSGLLVALLLPACAPSSDELDEFADESALQDPSLGKADEPGSTYTYFTVRPDTRRCAHPFCGGVFVDRVNRDWTRCAGGSWKHECYVPELDLGQLGLGEDQLVGVQAALGEGKLLLRGWIEDQSYGGAGNLGKFVASEAWIAGSETGYVDGVFVRAKDNQIVCITWPCISIHEAMLNSNQHADIGELDFWWSGANEDEVSKAWDSLISDDGLLVVGWRYSFTGPAGRAKGRSVNQFWRRVTAPEAGACYVGGCSSQVCSDRPDVITTCEWLPEYECYRTATCARQADGNCGWNETPELEQCLEGSR